MKPQHIEIDWDKFADRVPPGCRIKAHFAIDGMLLETRPYAALDFNSAERAGWSWFDGDHEEINSDHLCWQRFDPLRLGKNWQGVTMSAPTDMLFFIDKKWLLFSEVMA